MKFCLQNGWRVVHNVIPTSMVNDYHPIVFTRCQPSVTALLLARFGSSFH